MATEDIRLAEYQLRVDTGTGSLAGLRLGNGPDMVGHGRPMPHLGAALAYEPIEGAPRYHSHHADNHNLTVTCMLGPLLIHVHYALTSGLIERRVTVENAAEEEVQLTGVRLVLGGVSAGEPDQCLFDAPGNVVRPRVPLSVAASQPPGTGFGPPSYDYDFAPGKEHRWGRAIADAPDVGPGLLIVHNPLTHWHLLTWYVSDVQAAHPWVSGDGAHAALGFDVGLAGWLAPGDALTAGTQYIFLFNGPYEDALDAYRAYYHHSDLLPTLYPEPDHAADWAGVYEVHPGQFGGFQGLRGALPRLQDLGIDTLYLLPIYAHRNKRGLPWDENWESTGSPYAIHDFRRLEPSLGSEDDFRELVQEAHRQGMRVLVDLVLQGSSLESRYVEEHPEWYARNEQGEMVHSHGWNDTWSFDWANPDYQAFVIDYALDMVRAFDIDGFRVDAPHGKEPNWARGLPYHASRTNLGTSELLETLRVRLLEEKPSATLYCELFGPLWVRSHDISNDYHVWAMALQMFERRLLPYEFGEYLADYWRVMPHTADGTPTPRICFTETHDTRSWPAYALRGSDIEQALLGILVMSGFVPMIWSGQEARQHDFLRGLLLARRNSRALRRGDFGFNRVEVDDMGHYRRSQGDAPADHVFTVLRTYEDEALFGVCSLFPEKITYRFSLPVDDLPLDPRQRYRLRNLISYNYWNEFGRTEWTVDDLRSFKLSPNMFEPLIFRLEPLGR
ncbi:MAG: alpha-amylase family glycosyl hydrolase [Aggregatilineales bacterium]|nr:alpha-amylase family glycosyl hydrolase [Aggregatilineales bacterium]HQE16901.1 alpha-amylase family glycosyl hydrolase [Aggregatilineales bacterium]